MEPVEGTILTVVRVAAENTRARIDEFNTPEELLEAYLDEAKKALATTLYEFVSEEKKDI